MKSKKRLVCAGSYFGVNAVFAPLFSEMAIVPVGREPTQKPKLTPNDVVLLGGGEDITPSFYNQKPSRYCGKGEEPSLRDRCEQILFDAAVEGGAGIIGICRGAQLICALSGGSLVQHVTSHANGGHMMVNKDGVEMHVSSAHHQMMNPFKTEHELIAWAKENLSNVYLIEKEKNISMVVEPEVVWFPKTRGLAIQYHPEFMHDDAPAVAYSKALVEQYLLSEVVCN